MDQTKLGIVIAVDDDGSMTYVDRKGDDRTAQEIDDDWVYGDPFLVSDSRLVLIHMEALFEGTGVDSFVVALEAIPTETPGATANPDNPSIDYRWAPVQTERGSTGEMLAEHTISKDVDDEIADSLVTSNQRLCGQARLKVKCPTGTAKAGDKFFANARRV